MDVGDFSDVHTNLETLRKDGDGVESALERGGEAPETRFRGNVCALVTGNRRSGVDVSAETCIPDWDGERMDDDMVVEGLFRGFLPIILIALSGISLLAGLWFPVAILLDGQPSIITYGLVLFSFPLWIVGAIIGGVSGWLLKSGWPGTVVKQRVAWALVCLNLLVIVACLAWGPAGIS